MDLIDYCNHHSVGEYEIKQLETKFGFQMSESMKSWYLEHNGAKLVNCRFHGDEYCLVNIHPIANSWSEHELTMDKLLEWQRLDGFYPMHLVPFCSNSVGDDYFFEGSNTGNGKIYYVFLEILNDFFANPDDFLVATSFDDFFAKIESLT